jgi:hypothetical protein
VLLLQLLDIRVQGWLYHNAAALGSIKLLKWARKNDCVMTPYACQAAAGNGRLHALRWLRENGCPWDFRTLMAANYDDWISPKHLDCLRYAVENKCPGREGYTLGWEGYTHLLELD